MTSSVHVNISPSTLYQIIGALSLQMEPSDAMMQPDTAPLEALGMGVVEVVMLGTRSKELGEKISQNRARVLAGGDLQVVADPLPEMAVEPETDTGEAPPAEVPGEDGVPL